MSYILDALKKSEQERELVRMLRTAGSAGHFWAPARRRLWPTLVALALLVGVTLTVLRVWWPAQVSSVGEQMSESSPPPVAAVARQPAVAAPAPPPKAYATAVANKTVAEDNLSAQVSVAAPAKPVSATRPAVQKVSSRPDQGPAVAMAAIDPVDVPFLREMPANFRNKLPELVVNVHLYSADEAEHLVYINNQQFRKGEQLEGGIKLEQIVPEGVVLSYAGTYFKLPRPN